MKQRSKSNSNNKRPKITIKLNYNNDIYYSCRKPFSYDFFMAYIDGGRGIGKTTAFLIQGMLEVAKGNEFIYLRRYKPEIKKFVAKSPLVNITEGVTYKGFGEGGYCMYIENTVIGYAIPLSTQAAYKSVDFSKVTLIIFDEAILKPSGTLRYLKDEVPAFFLEFLSTVIRTRTNVRVAVLGNNSDLFSPYATYFDLPIYETIYYDKERRLYCEHAKNSPKLIEMEKKTGLYGLIKGTAYADYHYDNKVFMDNKYIIGEKPEDNKLMFRLTFDSQTLNVYQCYINDKSVLFCERREKLIDDNITYHILENGKINYLDANTFKMKLFKYLFKHYYNKDIIYEDDKAGAIVQWIIEEVK